jgi:hypothetical protein
MRINPGPITNPQNYQQPGIPGRLSVPGQKLHGQTQDQTNKAASLPVDKGRCEE